MRTRMNVMAGDLPADVFVPGDDWPDLYQDLDELLRHRPRQATGTGPNTQQKAGLDESSTAT
jgi:hypothetical protein